MGVCQDSSFAELCLAEFVCAALWLVYVCFGPLLCLPSLVVLVDRCLSAIIVTLGSLKPIGVGGAWAVLQGVSGNLSEA